jgi:hypothetical protein
LIAACIGQSISGFESRRLHFAFYCFQHNKYLHKYKLGLMEKEGTMRPLPMQTRGNRPLFQQIGNLGNNAVPDLRNGILVERHEDRTYHYNDKHHNEPAGHLVAARIGQRVSGFDRRHIDFVFHSFEHDKYLRFLI